MTKKSFSTSIKCGLYSNFVKNLTDAQRTSVRACGFSSLLHFDCTEAPRSVGYMLAQRFHVPTRTVMMENGSTFELNAFVAHQILGVPLGGWKVKDHASKSDKEIIGGDIGTGTVAPTIVELMKLVTPELSGDKFVRVFMLISLATLLCPTSYPRPSKKYYSAVASVADIPKYDWSFFIVDWLVDGIDDFQKSVAENYHMPTLCGCIIVLVFAFFEYIKAPDIILREDWPRIKVWDDRMVHEYLELEGMSEDDSFRHFELKDVSETPFVAAGSLSSTMFARLPAQVESFIENMAPHYDDNLSGLNNQTNARRQIRDMCSKFHTDIMGASISAIQPVVSKQLCSMAEFMWNYSGGPGTCAPGATDAPGSSVHMDSHGGDATPIQVHRESARGVTTRSRSKQRDPTPVSEGLRTHSRSMQKNSTFVPEVESIRSRSREKDSAAVQMETDAFMSSATRKVEKKFDGGMPSGPTNSVSRGMRSSEATKSSSVPEVVADSPQIVLQQKMKNKDSASNPDIDLQPNEADEENNEILDSSQDIFVGGRNPVAHPSVAQPESNVEVDTGQLGGYSSNLGTTPSNLDEAVPDSFEGEEPRASSHKRKIDAISSTAKEIESASVSNINKGEANQRFSEGLDNSKNLSHKNADDNGLHTVPQPSVSIPKTGNAKVVSGANKNLGGREQPVVEPSVTKTGVNDGAWTIVQNVIGQEQRGQDGTNSGDVPCHLESTSIGSINCAQSYSYTTPNFPTIPRIGIELSRFLYTSNLKSHGKGDNQSGSGADTRKRFIDSVVPDPFKGVGRPLNSSKRKAVAIAKTTKEVGPGSVSDSSKANKKQRLFVKELHASKKLSPESTDPIELDKSSSRMPTHVESDQNSAGMKQKDNVTPEIIQPPSVKSIPARGERKSSEQFARKRAQKPSVHLGTQDSFFNHPHEKIQLSTSEIKLYELATRRVSKRKQQESNIVANIGRFYITEDKFQESFKERGWVGNFEMDVFCEAMNLDYSSSNKAKPSKCFLTSDIVGKLRVTSKFNVSAVKEYVKKNCNFSLNKYDMVMIPVLEIYHWWLIVIDLRDHRFDLLNSCEMSASCLKTSYQICQNFRLLYESMYDKPNLDDFKPHPQPAPQQENNYDCGIFVMKFMGLWGGRKVSPMSCKHILEYRKQIVNYILRHPSNSTTTIAIKEAIRCKT